MTSYGRRGGTARRVGPGPPGMDARRNGPMDDAPQARPKIYAACASTAGKSIDTPRGTTSTGHLASSISFWAWALSST